MTIKTPPKSNRLVLVVLVASLIAVTGLLGLRNYVNGATAENTPTPLAIVENIETTTASPTPTLTVTPIPSSTATKPPPSATDAPDQTETPNPSPQPSEGDASAPTQTRWPSRTPAPTRTPTPAPVRPEIFPTFIPQGLGQVPSNLPPGSTLPELPVPTLDLPPGTTNILLLGIDEGGTNADAIVIVTINPETETASMLSIPRDTYLYVPEIGHMDKINTTISGGVDRVKQTIQYNFGIPIHYYALLDFEGFKQAVDVMDGVDVAVSCQLTDWRIISPDLDPEVEENYERITIEPGIHHMDGEFALWYARSRRSTTDFDRGRRQQQLLRSMLNQGVDLNLIAQAPQLWATYRDSVETDMDIGRMLQLAAMAPAIRENGIQHHYLVSGKHIQPYPTTDRGTGYVLIWEEFLDKMSKLALPPALNRATRPVITVEIVNGTDNPELSLLAAENLAWYGFEPILSDSRSPVQETTTIQYYGQNFKGSFDWIIDWVLDPKTSTIELVPDTEYEYDYRVVIGTNYNPCRPGQLEFETYSLDQ